MGYLIVQAKLMITLNQIGINYFPTAITSMVTEFWTYIILMAA